MVGRYKILILFLIAFSVVSVTSAHPGRTDKYGCHTCRTNCERWGLRYGEYHCHNTRKSKIKTENKINQSLKYNKNQQKYIAYTTDEIQKAFLVYNFQTKIQNFKTKIDGLKKRLDYIDERYLKNLPPDFPQDIRNNLINRKELINDLLSDINKIMDDGLNNFNTLLSQYKFNYLDLKKSIEDYLEPKFLNKIDYMLNNLDFSIDEFEKFLILVNKLYAQRYNRDNYYNLPNYSKTNACQQALNEINALQSQISNIRQQIMEEASKVGGLVTQSQLEEAVRFRAQDIYRQIDQKLFEIKTSGICD
jgi:hypothetical protein